MNIVEQVKKSGVVGAGGAGFPTHIKLAAQAEWFLANGAECEPLLHKDREVMIHFAQEIIEGLRLAVESVKAVKTSIGVKAKNQSAIKALRQAMSKTSFTLTEFGDYYPAGDEYEVVTGITGRLIPPQGLPLDVGCVVNNVETLYNVYLASQNIPTTEKFLTIAGIVKHPVTVKVPIGMSFREVLDLAGGPTRSDFAIMESGLMMGKPADDLGKPVTKLTGGLIALPADHDVIQRYHRTNKQMRRIGHSACDQCTYCTELCPRYLLGYDIQPHLVMRSLGFTVTGPEIWNEYALLCCRCGLCTLYACPEALYPREACIDGINDLRAIGKGKWQGNKEIQVHAMKDGRRVPIKLLMQRLGVDQYESHAEYKDVQVRPNRVSIALQQHVGVPAVPVVQRGESVKKGQLIADIPDDKLGAPLHASIDGTVGEISDTAIEIKATA
ncbi:NADH dehydrogenase subunit [candidate division KSB1 bacterium]|jgi:Na+-translocating ferredoxin:NAD+ oxidoreductase RnfC subunit|nr:NADH dehydrogenase subunit [candidate division KSB1 bacterium]